jgi:putative phosphoesterase
MDSHALTFSARERALPRIGLLSDSHGRAVRTRLAADLLVAQGADLLIHLGDIGSFEVIDALATFKPGSDAQLPACLVFGNTDYDLPSMTRYAQEIGVTVSHPVGRLSTPRGDLVYMHGDDREAYVAALQASPAYLCHGHTHCVTDQRIGGTRIINPGALQRAAQYSVALLDTEDDTLSFYPIA